MLENEMRHRDIFLNVIALKSIKDKATRGRTYQKRMRAGNCRFDKTAEWYPSFEDENLRFTGTTEATLDDQFDVPSLLCRGLADLPRADADDFKTEEEQDFEWHQIHSRTNGRSEITGY
jgi:hypothetical protein